MSCDYCSSPALYLCKCSNARVCSPCFDLHSSSPGLHQFLLLSEADPTYTASELFAEPQLIEQKIDCELLRLEGYRRNALQAVAEVRGEFTNLLRTKAREWREQWKPQFQRQSRDLMSACELLKSRNLAEELPSGGFPWANVQGELPESVIQLPEDMGAIDFSLEDLIQVGIEWDLGEYSLEQREKPKLPLAVAHSYPQPQPANSSSLQANSSTSEVADSLPSDRTALLQRLLHSETQRIGYIKERINSRAWAKLREEISELPDLSAVRTISTSDFGSFNEYYFDLPLLVLCCPALESFTLHSSSPSVSDFAVLCESLSATHVSSLAFPTCKLSTAHMSHLRLPATASTLDLSQNYFELPPAVLESAVSLRRLTVSEVPVRPQWVEEMLRRNPQVEVQWWTQDNSL